MPDPKTTTARPKTTDHLPKRKKAKGKMPTVTFEVEGWEGDFTVPDLSALPVGVQRKLTSGDINPLVDSLGEFAAVVDDMDNDEVQEFMEAWGKASNVDMGKSEPASN